MSSEDLSSRRALVDTYDLSDVVPVEGVGSVDPGTNVLVSGGPMLGTERLALELLAAGADDHAIAVTPDTDSSRLRDEFESVAGRLDPLCVVDCTGASGSGSFDDNVELREADEVGREARVLGHHESPRSWRPL